MRDKLALAYNITAVHRKSILIAYLEIHLTAVCEGKDIGTYHYSAVTTPVIFLRVTRNAGCTAHMQACRG